MAGERQDGPEIPPPVEGREPSAALGGGAVIKMRRPGDSLERARLLVENLLRANGLEPGRHQLSEGEEGCSWLFWAGSASEATSGAAAGRRVILVISVFRARQAVFFRVSSPLVLLPGEDRLLPFYRRLLDLNTEMVSACLATVGREVHVVSVRPVQDLDGSEVEDILRSVSGYADRLRHSLPEEFGVEVWEITQGAPSKGPDPRPGGGSGA